MSTEIDVLEETDLEFTLREDKNPDPDFYYRQQFRIYEDSFLIWDRETWEIILDTCTVYRIEIGREYAGDVILEERGRRRKYIVDFSILPEYHGKGVGRAVLEKIKEKAERLTAVTREETLPFFVKSGFVLERTLKGYYGPGMDGYGIGFPGKRRRR